MCFMFLMFSFFYFSNFAILVCSFTCYFVFIYPTAILWLWYSINELSEQSSTELLYQLIILLNTPHFSYCVLSLLQITTFSVVWLFGTSVFNTILWRCKLGEVENECTLHNFWLLFYISAKNCHNWWKFDGTSDKNNFAQFFWRHSVVMCPGDVCNYNYVYN